MKLVHSITLRLALFTSLIIAVWAFIFYVTIIREINDETDDTLEDYAEMLIQRSLRKEPLPSVSNGTNNQFFLQEISEAEAKSLPKVKYEDREVYIVEKHEYEPARVYTNIFCDASGTYYRLEVSTPHIDKSDMKLALLFLLLFLFGGILLVIVFLDLWTVKYTLRPLHRLLSWLDRYRFGQKNEPLDNATGIVEFQQLGDALQQSMIRNEKLYLQQKMFAENASHEMQTPLTVCQHRLETLLDDDTLSEDQMGEIIKTLHSLRRMAEMNRSLLLLCKIDNGQFQNTGQQDLAGLAKKEMADYVLIYHHKPLSFSWPQKPFIVSMDHMLATILVSNLLKNAFTHTEKGEIGIESDGKTFVVTNTDNGTGPLDSEHIFERFYHSKSKTGSTGLGLAIVKTICEACGLAVSYKYQDLSHTFTLSRL